MFHVNCLDETDPGTHETITVSGSYIPSYYFANNQYIKKVILDKDIYHIGICAFMNCYNLEEIVFNEELMSIESYAFYFCKSLKHLKFNKSLKKIGCNCFSLCFNILTINMIESSIECLYDNTFISCVYLKEFKFNANIKYFHKTSMPKHKFKYTVAV